MYGLSIMNSKNEHDWLVTQIQMIATTVFHQAIPKKT